MKSRKISNFLMKKLDCNKKVIASYVGVSENYLSNFLDVKNNEFIDNKLEKRIFDLYYIVKILVRNKSLTPSIIKKILVTPYYKFEDGTHLDVISAIHMEKISNTLLKTIAEESLKYLR